MSITDELRDWMTNNYSGWPSKQAEGYASADRIDAAHDEALVSSYFDGVFSDGELAENGFIRLPVDADGEIIHVGDVMEAEDNCIRKVDAMQVSSRKWSIGLVTTFDSAFSWHDADSTRHYHAPTVEDVLQKLLEQAVGYSDAHTTVALDAIAEFAAKLRLAESEDE